MVVAAAVDGSALPACPGEDVVDLRVIVGWTRRGMRFARWCTDARCRIKRRSEIGSRSTPRACCSPVSFATRSATPAALHITRVTERTEEVAEGRVDGVETLGVCTGKILANFARLDEEWRK